MQPPSISLSAVAQKQNLSSSKSVVVPFRIESQESDLFLSLPLSFFLPLFFSRGKSRLMTKSRALLFDRSFLSFLFLHTIQGLNRKTSTWSNLYQNHKDVYIELDVHYLCNKLQFLSISCCATLYVQLVLAKNWIAWRTHSSTLQQ